MDERYAKVLGLGRYQPKTEWICFLPWASEFGWYIMNHVKRFHGYNHQKKIACIKKGHECLFPTATEFWYDWVDDVKDIHKGGIVKYKHNDKVKKLIVDTYGKDVTFIDPAETGWAEKTSLGHHTFVPKPRFNHNFDIDIVITPRLRQLDANRNYVKQWQDLTNRLVKAGFKIAICGTKQLSAKINGAKYFSWNYVDVDTDVEMMLKSKLVISQESGLAYLAMMCKKPLIIIDDCMRNVADKHRDPRIYFSNVKYAWNQPAAFMRSVHKAVQ